MISHAVASLRRLTFWEELKPDWNKLNERLYTNHVTGLGWKNLLERLFLNMYNNQVRFLENQYKGSDCDEVKAQWDKTRLWFQRNVTARFPSAGTVSPFLAVRLPGCNLVGLDCTSRTHYCTGMTHEARGLQTQSSG